LTAEIHRPNFGWASRAIVTSRRQRSTGKTVFRITRTTPSGNLHVDFANPVDLAKRLFEMQHCGYRIEWPGNEAAPQVSTRARGTAPSVS
jgi:hypothetical protein